MAQGHTARMQKSQDFNFDSLNHQVTYNNNNNNNRKEKKKERKSNSKYEKKCSTPLKKIQESQ